MPVSILHGEARSDMKTELQLVESFIVSFVEERTKGSSSKHKLPTTSDVRIVAEKYFAPVLVDQVIGRIHANMTKVIVDGPYLCTEVKEIW